MNRTREIVGKIGSIVEFNFSSYFVYGAVIEEGHQFGDVLLMFAPKFDRPMENLDDLFRCPIRCKFKFFVKQALSKRNADIMRVVGRIDVARLPKVDSRFRATFPGISQTGNWRIIEGDQFSIADKLTPELAMLSDYGNPNAPFIKQYYDLDLYPWSSVKTSAGVTTFDTKELERTMRRRLNL